jgi:hypothetical protein
MQRTHSDNDIIIDSVLPVATAAGISSSVSLEPGDVGPALLKLRALEEVLEKQQQQSAAVVSAVKADFSMDTDAQLFQVPNHQLVYMAHTLGNSLAHALGHMASQAPASAPATATAQTPVQASPAIDDNSYQHTVTEVFVPCSASSEENDEHHSDVKHQLDKASPEQTKG